MVLRKSIVWLILVMFILISTSFIGCQRSVDLDILQYKDAGNWILPAIYNTENNRIGDQVELKKLLKNQYGIGAIPVRFLIDKNNKIVYQSSGFSQEVIEELSSKFKDLMS